jgi:hypothetical protein
LTATIRQVAGPEVAVIDPAPAVARQANRVHGARGDPSGLQARVSGDIDEFEKLSLELAGIPFTGGVLPLEGMSSSTLGTR